MKAVDVLARIDGFDHAVLVDVRGEGELHDEAVDAFVGVEAFDFAEQFAFGDIGVKLKLDRGDAAASAGTNLVAHIEFAPAVVSHQEGGETGRPMPLGHVAAHGEGDVGFDLCGHCIAIDEQWRVVRRHALGIPGMPGMRLIIWRRPLPLTIFIILRVWSNCLSRRLTSCTVLPDPLAMRVLRLALSTSG